MAGIMAASASRQDLSTGWAEDPQSSVERIVDRTVSGASGLELGMSGMNLVSSSKDNNNMSRSPIPNSGDSVHSVGTAASSNNQNDSFATASSCGNMGGTNRPPGLGLSPVPVIGKPGHAKSSSNSSTAHTATLTPTSSVDGGASNELSRDHHLPGINNLGSFDTDDGNHDGLLGLQALRERAQSSPGPTTTTSNNAVSAATGYSTSPRDFTGGSISRGGLLPQPSRPRLTSKDNMRSVGGSSRPPLAGGSALSPHTVDGGSSGAIGFPQPTGGNRSRGASPPPNAGVISRPETQYSVYGGSGGGGSSVGGESLDSTLRRALSNESIGTESSNYNSHRQQGTDHINSTFSQAPLNSQQRGGTGVPGFHGQGIYQSHQRSQSHSGPIRSMTGSDYYHEANFEAGFIPHRANASIPSGLETDYTMQQQQQQDVRYHSQGAGGSGGGGGYQSQYHPRHGRSMSMQHSPYSDEGQDMYGGGHQRRGSFGHQDGMTQRRDAEYCGGDGRLYERERVGNTSYHRQERFVSPSNSPMQSSYGSNSRHPGEGMNSTNYSASMSAPLYGRHRLTHSDEDLSHPLAGENIEVPEDQYYNGALNEGGMPPPYQRSVSMGHGPSYGSESHHLPTAGASFHAPRIVYNVKFKRTQRTFELGPRLNRDLKVGTYVKVEADRGEDLGIVIGKVKNSLSRSTSYGGGGIGEIPTAGAGGGGDLKKIIRLATHDEVSLLQMKREEEEELLKVCRAKVRQRGMPMHVVDAEYQFDRHKLTFFFEADTRIDFRELVRDLFSIYKTRIWMQQLDKNTAATCPTAPAPAPLVMDYGTPIIAPVSEYEGFAQAPGASDGTD